MNPERACPSFVVRFGNFQNSHSQSQRLFAILRLVGQQPFQFQNIQCEKGCIIVRILTKHPYYCTAFQEITSWGPETNIREVPERPRMVKNPKKCRRAKHEPLCETTKTPVLKIHIAPEAPQ